MINNRVVILNRMIILKDLSLVVLSLSYSFFKIIKNYFNNFYKTNVRASGRRAVSPLPARENFQVLYTYRRLKKLYTLKLKLKWS